ncbi:hypothetical protein PQR62_17565 [Herbaspirillum lusitanum]|uniref:Uncharacterized protein n=1 Tax=Herbaspirillum lusitanum TaxID=213312 RepID=A0ABW9AB20_9BURK
MKAPVEMLEGFEGELQESPSRAVGESGRRGGICDAGNERSAAAGAPKSDEICDQGKEPALRFFANSGEADGLTAP